MWLFIFGKGGLVRNRSWLISILPFKSYWRNQMLYFEYKQHIFMCVWVGIKWKDSINDSYWKSLCLLRSQRIACDVQPRLDSLQGIRVNLTDLVIVNKTDSASAKVFELISPRSIHHRINHGGGFVGFLSPEKISSGKFTFLHPSTLKSVVLSVYDDVTLDLPGFIVNDPTCYAVISDFIDVDSDDILVSLIIAWKDKKNSFFLFKISSF